MKILQIIPFFYPAKMGTGPAYVAYNISKELVKNGHEIIVYTSNSSDTDTKLSFRYRNFDGIKISYFDTLGKKIAWDNRLFITPQMIIKLRKTVKEFDIIHLHDYRTFQNIIVWFYAKIYRVPYIIQAHGTTNMEEKKLIKYIFDIIIGNRLLKDAERLIALSTKEVDLYKKMNIPIHKISIVPNGIGCVRHNLTKGNFKGKYKINNNERLILFVGRIHRIKGLEFLIRSFYNVLDSYPNVKLAIVGPKDNFYDQLTNIIDKYKLTQHIILTGYLEGVELYNAYIDSDFFVLPSIYDAFPISVLEACSFGLPVIITENNGLVEWIENRAGIVVEYDNINQLTNAILTLLNDQSLIDEYSDNGKKLIQNYFTWERITKNIEFVYSQIIKI